MNEKRKKWLEAAKTLSVNKTANVNCPECQIGFLSVKDVLVKESNQVDRYLVCDNCGKWNVITSELKGDSCKNGNVAD